MVKVLNNEENVYKSHPYEQKPQASDRLTGYSMTSQCDGFLNMVICSRHATTGIYITNPTLQHVALC